MKLDLFLTKEYRLPQSHISGLFHKSIGFHTYTHVRNKCDGKQNIKIHNSFIISHEVVPTAERSNNTHSFLEDQLKSILRCDL